MEKNIFKLLLLLLLTVVFHVMSCIVFIQFLAFSQFNLILYYPWVLASFRTRQQSSRMSAKILRIFSDEFRILYLNITVAATFLSHNTKSLKLIFFCLFFFQKPLGPHALFPPRPGKICDFLHAVLLNLFRQCLLLLSQYFCLIYLRNLLIALQVCTFTTCGPLCAIHLRLIRWLLKKKKRE